MGLRPQGLKSHGYYPAIECSWSFDIDRRPDINPSRLGRKSGNFWQASSSAVVAPALASHYHSGRLKLCRLCLICRRQPTPPTVTAGGSGFVVFVLFAVASQRLPLSQRAAQALSSLSYLSSPANASHCHSGRLRLCRLCPICSRQPTPPTVTAGGSGFVVFVLFVVASQRLPLSQRTAQALSSLSYLPSPANASHCHSGRLRLCRLCPILVVARPRLPLQAWSSLSCLPSPANASHCHSGRLRLCRLCPICRRQPPPPTITAGGSGFVVFVPFVVASQRLPLSQRAAQALSSVSYLPSPANASHCHSGRLRLCRLCPICRRQPSPPTITAGGSSFVVFVLFAVASQRLPLSQRAAQALSSSSYLSSPANASHYHSGRLRLCRLCPICRLQPSPPTNSGRLRLCGLCHLLFTATVGPRHRNKSCLPNCQTDHLLKQNFLGSPVHGGEQHTRQKILQAAKGTRKQTPN